MSVFKIVVLLAAILILILIAEALLASRNRPEGFKNPNPDPQYFGNGPDLSYVVIGDSTGAGQGSAYGAGIAVGSAKHLANNYKVELVNLSVSGAKAEDVVKNQLAKASALKPDIVLVSVGANDTTGLTSPEKVRQSLAQIASELKKSNCKVKIVMTGTPNMGTSPRFLQPLRSLAGLYSARMNRALYPWIEANHTLAPIAKETTKAFNEDPTLFDSDRFHPNSRGYEVWLKTINPALDKALKKESNC